MLDRERRDCVIITIGLLIALFIVYENVENGWGMQGTIVISTVVTIGAYLQGKRLKGPKPPRK